MASTLRKDKPTLILNNIQSVLENKRTKDTFTFVFTPEKGFYIKDGKKFKEKEIDDLYPTLSEIAYNKGKIIGHRGY